MKRTALVTGGNRGIGLEVAGQLARLGHRVILGCRDARVGETVAAEMQADGLDVAAHALEVTSDDSVRALQAVYPMVDILVNNAGVYSVEGLVKVSAAEVLETLNINAIGAHRLTQAYAAGMRERGWGRIVNVSSEMSQSASWDAYAAIYRASKAALNALTVGWADELRGSGVLVNVVDPGWVQTRMGGSSAPRTVQQGAANILYAVNLPDDGPTGTFTRDGLPLRW